MSGDARFLGPVSAELLEGLYAAAALLATTTLHEGFGLPVLEAMARGVPVAASDLAVLREVAGDAAIWHDPRDPSSVAAALRRLLAGGAEVERLRAAGRDRAQRFSWRATAEATARVYDRALSARAPRRPARASA